MRFSSRAVIALVIFTISIQLGFSIKNEALELCVESDPFGMSTNIIPDNAIIASSSISHRNGHYGRLFNDSSWQAKSNNFNQYLQINLGGKKLIVSVATQGFRGSGQFVMDYYIHYSNDASTYIPIVNDLKEPKVFPGNTHDDAPQFNSLDYPLVAQYVRFVPRRWSVNIAMRVEIYGCKYEDTPVHFDGSSYITFNAFQPNTLFTTTDMMRMRIKTDSPEGLIFYAAGNQGDYICLEMMSGRLYLDIRLGVYTQARGVAGSLLDDNQWHDVELARKDKNITISVDRVPVNITILTGEFRRLDLDRYLFLGGVPTFYQPGISVFRNYTGCIENMVWNGIYMTRDKSIPRFQVYGQLSSNCEDQTSSIPHTFTKPSSYMTFGIEDSGSSSLKVEFQFRTFNNEGLLVWMNLLNGGEFFLSVDNSGRVKYELTPRTGGFPIDGYAVNDKNQGSYSDGLWHHVSFNSERNKITMIVDKKMFITTRQIEFKTTNEINIGGKHTERLGFVGCIRRLSVQNSPVIVCDGSIECDPSVLYNQCTMEDRCRPNPCEHGSTCRQTFLTFDCDCSGTGYQGAVCHQPSYENSCSRIFEMNPLDQGTIDATIDIDGAGSMAPFKVQCTYSQEQGAIETRLHHDSEFEVIVDGYQLPKYYQRVINYETGIPQMDQLTDRAHKCRQLITYRCEGSKLFTNPGTSEGGVGSDGRDRSADFQTYGWWVGRNYQRNYYWGGSAPGTRMCKCGIEGNCRNAGSDTVPQICNCDAELNEQDISDSGFLQHKQHLPVLELYFGDTGGIGDSKKGWHKLGPLECYGDRLFDQPITFRKMDALVYFDTFWSRESADLTTWDIGFRFKTTQENGLMIRRDGENGQFVEIKLVTSTSLTFRFNAGYGSQSVVVDQSFELNNDEFHTVYAERNRKEAVLKVDKFQSVTLKHPQGISYIPFKFTRPLFVGATEDGKDGFVGCMSALQMNGETLDMYDKVENDPRFSYGLVLGCVGQCSSNKCLHTDRDVRCKEKYDDFVCDCSYTPWRGLICGREVGANFQGGAAVVYNVTGDLKTNSENITIGFLTTKQQGVLMHITDHLDPNLQTQYMTFEIEASGAIVMSLKTAELRDDQRYKTSVRYSDISFLKQPHVIKFNRMENGRRIELQIDDYPVKVVPSSELDNVFPQSSDVYLEVKHIIIGRNMSNDIKHRFEGCLFRVEFDNHWPLKRAFQEPKPNYTMIINAQNQRDPEAVFEDRCGFEEILPEPVYDTELRPTYEPLTDPVIYQDQLEEKNYSQNVILLAVVFSVVGIVLIVVISIVVFKCRSPSDYSDVDEEEIQPLDDPESKHEDYRSDYNPRSSREQYEMKTRSDQPSSQAFI